MGSSEGVFPQTDWEKQFCVFIYSHPKGRGQKATRRSPGFLGTATSNFPKPKLLWIQTLAVGSSVIPEGTSWRLETCRAVVMLLHSCTSLPTSSQVWTPGSISTATHTHSSPDMSTLFLAAPQFYTTSQVVSTPCIPVPLPKIFFHPHQL